MIKLYSKISFYGLYAEGFIGSIALTQALTYGALFILCLFITPCNPTINSFIDAQAVILGIKEI